MKEDFLHYLWKHKKFPLARLKTEDGRTIELLSTGRHNHLAGPDFFNAQLKIDGQHWAGNVEIHSRSSDWYAHNHERDMAYDNVILHVVWESDIQVFGKNGLPLPTLELKPIIEPSILEGYQRLFTHRRKQFINCENDFGNVPDTLVADWLERLYFERLERKVKEIEVLLEEGKGDWEATLFKMLSRNFGTKINASSFQDLATTIPFSVIRKVALTEGKLEWLFFGQGGILPQDSTETEVITGTAEFRFLKAKFQLARGVSQPVQFFRLRPDNFPTIRLSQLAVLYEQGAQLFERLMACTTAVGFYEFFNVKASTYWETHYSFGKSHKKKTKKLTKAFIDLLLINTVIPLKFAYMRSRNDDGEEEILNLITSLSAEKNSIVERFTSLKKLPQNALNSQALLQLKAVYCDPNLCLKCRIGNFLISKSPLDVA